MKIRNGKEKERYLDLVDSAIDKAAQAIDNITYMAYPEINQRTIAKLREAMCLLDQAYEACIFKP